MPKALHFAPSQSDEANALSRHMFQEDIYTGIFPYHFARGDENKIFILGEEQEKQKLFALFDSLGRGHSYSTEDSARDAVDQIALRLAHYGVALFEIVKNSENSSVVLSSFNPDFAWRLPAFYLQIAPRYAWTHTDRKYALLKKNEVWRVTLPATLGSVQQYRAMLSGLSAWSVMGPDFLEAELEKKRRFPSDFVVADYHRMLQVHQYRVTRRWGWIKRDWSLDYVTEFYQFHRFLTFRWAQAVLRDHIVSELNALTARLNIKAKIHLQKLASPEEILDIRGKMKQGLLDFAGAAKALA